MSTLQIIKEHVMSNLKLDATVGSEDDTQVTQAIDLVGRRLWQMHAWPEREKYVVVTTVGLYSSTSSITVTVTSLSTTLTGSGTTFTAAMVGRKFALGWNRVFYRISAYVSATQLTLDRVYQEATASGQQFLIYQDEIDVATDVDTVETCHFLINNLQGPALAVGRAVRDDYSIVQSGAGKPRVVSLVIPTTAGTKRLGMTPAPDGVYAMVVTYHKTWTKLTNPGDVTSFDDNREWLLVEGAMLYAQRLSQAEKTSSEPQLIALAQRAWRDAQPHVPVVFQREPWGGRGGMPVPGVTITVA